MMWQNPFYKTEYCHFHWRSHGCRDGAFCKYMAEVQFGPFSRRSSSASKADPWVIADEKGELSEASTLEAGREIQGLQEMILEPLKHGAGQVLGAFCALFMASAAVACTGLATPEKVPIAIGGIVVTTMNGILSLLPLAMITSKARRILATLNDCRTIGKGDRHGLVSVDVNARISTLEDYMLRLNDGDGPGAVVCTQVISTKLLVGWLMMLGRYGGIGVPLLLRFQGQLNAEHAGSGST